jgi:hypothetical protein
MATAASPLIAVRRFMARSLVLPLDRSPSCRFSSPISSWPPFGLDRATPSGETLPVLDLDQGRHLVGTRSCRTIGVHCRSLQGVTIDVVGAAGRLLLILS